MRQNYSKAFLNSASLAESKGSVIKIPLMKAISNRTGEEYEWGSGLDMKFIITKGNDRCWTKGDYLLTTEIEEEIRKETLKQIMAYKNQYLSEVAELPDEAFNYDYLKKDKIDE